MSSKENQLEKASRNLKEKLGKNKLKLSDYKLVAEKVPATSTTASKLAPPSEPQSPHKTKPLKYTFYLSETARDALNEAFIMHYAKNDKISKSEIACDALVEYLKKIKK